MIVKATAITSFYGMINRMVSALGVELEDGMDAWVFGAQK
jgi:hypothetical protein